MDEHDNEPRGGSGYIGIEGLVCCVIGLGEVSSYRSRGVNVPIWVTIGDPSSLKILHFQAMG